MVRHPRRSPVTAVGVEQDAGHHAPAMTSPSTTRPGARRCDGAGGRRAGGVATTSVPESGRSGPAGAATAPPRAASLPGRALRLVAASDPGAGATGGGKAGPGGVIGVTRYESRRPGSVADGGMSARVASRWRRPAPPPGRPTWRGRDVAGVEPLPQHRRGLHPPLRVLCQQVRYQPLQGRRERLGPVSTPGAPGR